MSLEKSLIPLQGVGGYLASAIFDMNGDVLVMHNNSEYRIDLIGAHAVQLITAAISAFHGAELGDLNFIQANSDSGVFGATWVLEGKYVAAVLLLPTGNVGLAKIALKQSSDAALKFLK